MPFLNKNAQLLGREKYGVGDRGSVRPSGGQIKAVTETRSSGRDTAPGMGRTEPRRWGDVPPAMAEGAQGADAGLPGPGGREGRRPQRRQRQPRRQAPPEGAASSSGFARGGPAGSERRCAFGYVQGAPGTRGVQRCPRT